MWQRTYPSQREDPSRRADRIRERLGWEPGILNGPEGKPKGMHWRTFERLYVEHGRLAQVSLGQVVRRFGLLGFEEFEA